MFVTGLGKVSAVACAAAAGLALLSASTARAAVVDNMSSLANFGTPVGGLIVTQNPGPPPNVTLQNATGNNDELVDWEPNTIPLATNDILTINYTSASASMNPGFLFFGPGGFITEHNLGDVPTAGPLVVNVDQLAAQFAPAATAYTLRLRDNDGGAGANSLVTLNSIVTTPVPEPASLGLLGIGATVLIGRRRRA